MINLYEVTETNKMIEEENLDVREPDDGKGRLGGRRPCMGPGPTGRMCAAAAIFIREFRPAGAVAGYHFQLVSTDSGGRSPAGRGRVV